CASGQERSRPAAPPRPLDSLGAKLIHGLRTFWLGSQPEPRLPAPVPASGSATAPAPSPAAAPVPDGRMNATNGGVIAVLKRSGIAPSRASSDPKPDAAPGPAARLHGCGPDA